MAKTASLLALLDSVDVVEAKTAMIILSNARSGRSRLLPGLLHRLHRAPFVYTREAAAYVLYGWSDLSNGLWEKRITIALLATLTDAMEEPNVRGQAAEALAWHCLMRGRCSAVLPLLATLDDPSPEVRFWAAYALGIIGAREALPALERLAMTDHAIVQWSAGTVGKEAADAIIAIHARRRWAHPPRSHYRHRRRGV